jgi:hypothetical protein
MPVAEGLDLQELDTVAGQDPLSALEQLSADAMTVPFRVHSHQMNLRGEPTVADHDKQTDVVATGAGHHRRGPFRDLGVVAVGLFDTKPRRQRCQDL